MLLSDVTQSTTPFKIPMYMWFPLLLCSDPGPQKWVWQCTAGSLVFIRQQVGISDYVNNTTAVTVLQQKIQFSIISLSMVFTHYFYFSACVISGSQSHVIQKYSMKLEVCFTSPDCSLVGWGQDLGMGWSRSQTLASLKAERGSGVLSDISCHMGWGRTS